MLGNALQNLCELLEDELERQENVLAVVKAQGEAAQARNLEVLELRTAALGLLIEQAAQAEPERLRLVAEVVAALQLPVEEQTLTGLIAVAPEPWRGRLALFQERMQSLLVDTRRAVRANNSLIRRSLTRVNRTLQAVLQPEKPSQPLYSASGSTGAVALRGLLDQRG